MKKLILVTVPIGNIQDITERAKNSLDVGTQFLVEDSRVFKKLLNILGISLREKKIFSLHDHTEKKEYSAFLNLLKENDLYLVSDAGSPIISDPAFPFIDYVISNGVEVESNPGVSSIITALELSGLPVNPFHFHGFITREGKKRRDLFAALPVGTHVFFEGMSRVIKTLEEITKIHPEAKFVVARELTKKFQSVYRFKGSDFKDTQEDIIIKGEFVLLCYIDKENQKIVSDDINLLAEELIASGYKKKVLSKLLGSILNLNPKDIYKKLID